jgi:hypothetical protein
MTIASLASQAPMAYELLRRIGLERRRSRAIRAATYAGWLGVGLALGGGLAMLLTPRSGPQMRERLGEQGKRARDYVAPGTADLPEERPGRRTGRAASPVSGQDPASLASETSRRG